MKEQGKGLVCATSLEYKDVSGFIPGHAYPACLFM